MNYLLISGNPPAAYFYELWKDEMVALQPGSKAKVSLYPVLSRESDSSKAMDQVLSAHLQQLQNFYETAQAPVTVIGHSLGGYFAMRLLAMARDKIEKVVLVYPTLREPHLKGRLILRALSAFYTFENLQRVFLSARKKLEIFSTDLSFVTDEEISKTFHLIQHENAVVASDRSQVLISPEDRSKVKLFYNRSDIWCHSKVVESLKNQVSVFECAEPHDFVTKEVHRRSLFKKILESTLHS